MRTQAYLPINPVDIAVQLLQLQKDKSVDPIVTSMKQLNAEVEEVLNEE